MKDQLTNLEHWEEEWGDIESAKWDNGFHEFIPDMHTIVKKYKTILSKGSCIEIGCYPGRYLRYFAREFDMDVSGIDIMPYKDDDTNSSSLSIEVADFNEYQIKRKFDLVCSFGFIEHFNNLYEVIKKHVDLANDNGLVVISVPNYSVGWRFFLKRIRDKSLFISHNRDAMIIKHLDNVLKSIECKEYTLQHILFSQKLFNFTSPARRNLGKIINKIIRIFPFIDKGFSGEILMVIKK